MQNEAIELKANDAAASPNEPIVRLPLSAYDPNKRWHPQTVKVTVMQWEYKKELETLVKGNCLGFNIFDAAIESLMDDMPVDGRGTTYITLEDKAGNTLVCEASMTARIVRNP